jgi:hypothetical protein
MTAPDPGFAAEPTAIGLQTLVPGVTPITSNDRMALRAAAPLASRKPQRPCDVGLFDLGRRDQIDLFNQLPPPRGDG